MGTVLILGGTGQVGRAAAGRLARDGWEVTLAARNRPDEELAEFRFRHVDRTRPGALEAAVEGIDVLVDLIPFTPADGRQLVSLAGHVSSIVAMSSGAVYEMADPEVPIAEDRRTVEASDSDYPGRKRFIEQLILDVPELKATVLRAGAIYGPHSPHPREWYFVKRVLDGRRLVVLARQGASIFQTVSVHNLAELIALAAKRPGTRVLNGGDPEAPTAVEIARVIAHVLEHEWNEVLMPGPEQDSVGSHPWNVPAPVRYDMRQAVTQLNYSPAVTYADAIPETVDWLVSVTRGRDWREVFRDWRYLDPLFDYAAEDAYVAARIGPPGSLDT